MFKLNLILMHNLDKVNGMNLIKIFSGDLEVNKFKHNNLGLRNHKRIKMFLKLMIFQVLIGEFIYIRNKLTINNSFFITIYVTNLLLIHLLWERKLPKI